MEKTGINDKIVSLISLWNEVYNLTDDIDVGFKVAVSITDSKEFEFVLDMASNSNSKIDKYNDKRKSK